VEKQNTLQAEWDIGAARHCGAAIKRLVHGAEGHLLPA